MELHMEIAAAVHNFLIIQEHIPLGMLDLECFFFIIDHRIDAAYHTYDTICSWFEFKHSTFLIRAEEGLVSVEACLHIASSSVCRLRTSRAHARNTF